MIFHRKEKLRDHETFHLPFQYWLSHHWDRMKSHHLQPLDNRTRPRPRLLRPLQGEDHTVQTVQLSERRPLQPLPKGRVKEVEIS